jgi:hypothetical protein
MKLRRILLSLLLPGAVLGVFLFCTSAHAGIWEKYCRSPSGQTGQSAPGVIGRVIYRAECGPVYWRWKLPPGNGHYMAPNPCLGPPAYYTPQLPLYYRGAVLRTIDMPIDEPLP